jgi:hypothetical protein
VDYDKVGLTELVNYGALGVFACVVIVGLWKVGKFAGVQVSRLVDSAIDTQRKTTDTLGEMSGTLTEIKDIERESQGFMNDVRADHKKCQEDHEQAREAHKLHDDAQTLMAKNIKRLTNGE